MLTILTVFVFLLALIVSFAFPLKTHLSAYPSSNLHSALSLPGCTFCRGPSNSRSPCSLSSSLLFPLSGALASCAAGDLKLSGPLTGQVKMLLEENAALQVAFISEVHA